MFFLYYCDAWGYIVPFTQVLQCVKYIIHEFTPSIILLHPSPLQVPGVVSIGIIFAFTYMCTHFIAPYSPSYPLSWTPSSSHWYHPSPGGRACSALLFFDFVGFFFETESCDAVWLWAQGYMIANKCSTGHTCSPFCSGYFGGGVLQTICPGCPRTVILLISASQVARITGMSHQLCLGLLRAEITGTYHYVWFREGIFFFFFLVVLGFELRASCLLDRLSTPWATLPAQHQL
jgi:hypothetical protein